MIEILLNGERRQVPAEATILELLKLVDLPTEGVAVALNGKVVRRSEHGTQRARAGDRVEIVRAVGGG